MNFNEPNRATGGRLVAGFLLALVLGALAPAVTILEMSLLLPVIMFGGVFMVFLYGYAGRMPAWLYMVTLLSSTAYLMGGRFMWMMLVGGAMPAIIVMQGIYMKQSFFDQMRRGILYYGLGLVVALYIAYTAYGANMIGRLTDTVQSQFKSMPDEFFLPFVETVNSALSAGGVDASRLITVEYYRAQVAALVPLMGDTYAQTLPGLLLAGGLLSGVLSVAWGNWRYARRGLASAESFIGMTRWFLPGQVTFGLLSLWLAAFILTRTDYAAAQTVYVAVYQIISAAFMVQALCAVDRFGYRRGMSARRRHVWMAVLLALSALFRLPGAGLFIIGAASALFGSHGAFRTIKKPGGQDHSDGDDPDQ